jgi:hypothetical protein
MAGRATLVKSVLTRIAIYCITVLNVSVEVLMKIDNIRRAFLWAASDKVSGGSKFKNGMQAKGIWRTSDSQPRKVCFGPSYKMAMEQME